MVLKEAVDDAEEESKAGKTEIEKCINHENGFCDKIAYLQTKYDICVYLLYIRDWHCSL